MPTIVVKVKPSARHAGFEPGPDGTWLASVKAPPVDGRANDELVALVARHFGCPRSAVSVRSGAGARLKRLDIDAPIELSTAHAGVAGDAP